MKPLTCDLHLARRNTTSLSRAPWAVLPAFASPVYLTRKASSSVAAAIICGTPLLADPALLQAYSYLPPNAVFETTADERLAVAVSRIATHSSEVRITAPNAGQGSMSTICGSGPAIRPTTPGCMRDPVQQTSRPAAQMACVPFPVSKAAEPWFDVTSASHH